MSSLSQCLELIRSDGSHTDTDAQLEGMEQREEERDGGRERNAKMRYDCGEGDGGEGEGGKSESERCIRIPFATPRLGCLGRG